MCLCALFIYNLVPVLFIFLGNNIIEIGANWIHGPSEENPVFRLARQYDLLEAEALTPENQAIEIKGPPPQLSNWFSSSGGCHKPYSRLSSVYCYLYEFYVMANYSSR